MNKLSLRLTELVNLCPNAQVYADIGCDHGYVTLELISQGKAQHVIAVDIHAKSLNKTKELLAKNNLSNKSTLIVSDGFKELSKQQLECIDCAVIAGMGGQEIIKILDVFQPKCLILQPMKNSCDLRKYLVKKQYFIEKDYLFKEKNKFYDIISCFKGKSQQLSELQLLYGKDNFKSSIFKEYLLIQKEKCNKILSTNFNSKTQNDLQNIQNALILMQGR